jgi:NTP pyrophosphatase (non-canonical NTP hydrolase)
LDSHKQLLTQFNQLADANGWHSKHSPKNLSMAISVEAAELLEIFQWLGEKDSFELSPEQRQQVGHEMADVFLYLLSLADQLNIDLVDAAKEKMRINKQRLPADA